MYRIDLSLALNETYGEEGMKVKALKKFKNGRTIEETLDYMENLVKAGVTCSTWTSAATTTGGCRIPRPECPRGASSMFHSLSSSVSKSAKFSAMRGFPCRCVAVGKLGYPDLAEKALRDGMCDMIMLGRPLLADPNGRTKPTRARSAKSAPASAVRKAASTSSWTAASAVRGQSPHRLEEIMPEAIAPAEVKKQHRGRRRRPAGVLFAIQAARRGHKVDLFEKDRPHRRQSRARQRAAN
jgi:2-enoate reductase